MSRGPLGGWGDRGRSPKPGAQPSAPARAELEGGLAENLAQIQAAPEVRSASGSSPAMALLEFHPAAAETRVISSGVRTVRCRRPAAFLIGEDSHDAPSRLAVAEQVGHEPHRPLSVGKESLQAIAEPVQSGLAVARRENSVFRTLAVTGEEEPAFAALARQARRLGPAEGPLPLRE